MLLTNSSNLNYRHKESGDLYTLLYVGNETADQSVLNEHGVPKWLPQACYRKDETGEIYVRPMAEFDMKFELVFPELRELLDLDMEALIKEGVLKSDEVNRRLITLLGVAKELWTLFPLIKLDARIDIIRGLNFTDFVNVLGAPDEFFLQRMGQRAFRLPAVFAKAGASLSKEATPAVSEFTFDKTDDASHTLGLLMVGVSASLRELKFLNAISVEESQIAEHTEKQEVLISSIRETAKWFDGIGVTIALPTLKVVASSFDSQFMADSN